MNVSLLGPRRRIDINRLENIIICVRFYPRTASCIRCRTTYKIPRNCVIIYSINIRDIDGRIGSVRARSKVCSLIKTVPFDGPAVIKGVYKNTIRGNSRMEEIINIIVRNGNINIRISGCISYRIDGIIWPRIITDTGDIIVINDIVR